MASLQNPAASLISVLEKRQELHRVLESKYFKNSPKKSRFLEFVAEQTFSGEGQKLNEYLIGVEAYERGVDFDPQQNPIVRVQAHEIRQLLKKYYAEEGKSNLIRMDLPPGHYVPQFKRSPGEQTDFESSAGGSQAGVQRKSSQLSWVAIVLLSGLCVVLAILVVNQRAKQQTLQSHVQSQALPESLQWFWEPFLSPLDPPLITIPNHPLLRAAHEGDSQQTLTRGHEIAKSDFPEFRDTIHFHELKRFLFVPSLTDFTSVGETLGVVELCEMFSSVGQKCRVQQSRLVNLDEIKGQNSILLGGNQAWSGRVFLNLQGFHFQSGVILNKNPQSGEQPVYKPEFDPLSNQLTRDYALVLMLPNETKNRRVLLVYGIYTQGSQAAMEYLINPERMAELHQALQNLSPDHRTVPPYFQLLLTTTVENAVPAKPSLVSLRIIPN
ncbi:MAG TPA: hypothetical protein VMS18_07780 [Candidatus Binatia bacterium]|nr:hypothetical protein [Candidatus Binatia bacterium]